MKRGGLLFLVTAVILGSAWAIRAALSGPDYVAALSVAADWSFDGDDGCRDLAAVLRIDEDENLTVFRDGDVVSSGVIIGREVITNEAVEAVADAQTRLSLRYVLNYGEGAAPFTILRDTFVLRRDDEEPYLQLEKREYRANPERAWQYWMREFAPLGAAEDPRWHGEQLRLC